MTRRPQLARLLVPVLALVAATGRAAAAGPPDPGAVQLLATAERAHAAAVAAVAAAPGWIGAQHSGHAAVAQGLDEVGGALARVRASLGARDAGLPRALRRGSVALAGLRVAWSRAGLAAPAAGRRLRELAVAFDALRARCGPEGARAARGGPLTPAEREQLARVQEARRAFAAALDPLGVRATARGDRWLAGELRRWSVQSARIAAAPPAVETLLEAVWLADHLQGEWTAASPHVPPPDRGDWLAAHAAVEEVLGESEVGYLVVADLGGADQPLSVEPAAPAATETDPGEPQVLAPQPIVLFQPPEPEEGWVEDEKEAVAAEATEESAEPAGEESAAAEEELETEPAEGEAEEAEESAEAEATATTIEVVSESGEVLTVEIGGEAAAEPPPAAADPAPAEPAPAAPPPSP